MRHHITINMLLSSFLFCCVTCVFAQEWELYWSDEFNGASIDLSKWQHEITAWGGGNGEFQTYTPDALNSYIQDEKLFLKATRLSQITNPSTGQPYGEEFLDNGTLDLIALYGECHVDNDSGCFRTGHDIPPMASSRLRSADRFSYRYGRAEIFAKMPVGDWLWPALWLLPEKWLYGGWPMSGEIDMTESIGNRNYRCGGMLRGIQHMGSTLHWGISWDQNRYYLTTSERHNEAQNFGDFFHLYELEWGPNGMEFFLDGEKILSVPDPLINEDTSCFTGFYDFGGPWNGGDPWTTERTCDHYMAPFDQDFHFIFNVAVGGTNWFIPDDCVNWDGEAGREKPWRNGMSQRDGGRAFYDNIDSWEDTWVDEGDNNAMQIDYVRVYKPAGGYGRTEVPAGCPQPPGPDNCPPEVGP